MVSVIGLTSCRDVETNGEIFRSRVLPLPIANPPGGGGVSGQITGVKGFFRNLTGVKVSPPQAGNF